MIKNFLFILLYSPFLFAQFLPLLQEEYEALVKSAEHGNVEAQYKLGYTFRNGPVNLEVNSPSSFQIPLDNNKAKFWLEKAALQNHAKAQYSLGLLYDEGGLNFQRNTNLAKFWYLKSAIQENKDAQFNLAIYYKFGISVEKSIVQYYFWLSKAAMNGHQISINILNEHYFGK